MSPPAHQPLPIANLYRRLLAWCRLRTHLVKPEWYKVTAALHRPPLSPRPRCCRAHHRCPNHRRPDERALRPPSTRLDAPPPRAAAPSAHHAEHSPCQHVLLHRQRKSPAQPPTSHLPSRPLATLHSPPHTERETPCRRSVTRCDPLTRVSDRRHHVARLCDRRAMRGARRAPRSIYRVQERIEPAARCRDCHVVRGDALARAGKRMNMPESAHVRPINGPCARSDEAALCLLSLLGVQGHTAGSRRVVARATFDPSTISGATALEKARPACRRGHCCRSVRAVPRSKRL